MFLSALLAASNLLFGLQPESGKGPTPIPPPREDPIVQLVDRDAIPAIRRPEFVSADRAKLADGEKVLGVIIEGQTRAYPLIDLDAHEIVDDVVGGRAIAATW